MNLGLTDFILKLSPPLIRKAVEPEKELTALLRNLVELLAEEASRSAEFADKLDRLLAPLPNKKASAKAESGSGLRTELPDLYAEHLNRGESEFEFCLRDLPASTLRLLIKSNDFDPKGRTSKWQETEKLATFIRENLRARLGRGAAFMKGGQSSG